MSALSERLKECAKTVKQQALEAKSVYDTEQATELQQRDNKTRLLLEEKLREILPEVSTIKFDGAVAVVDAGSDDELRFRHNMGPVLLGICPNCSQEAESAEIYSLHQLGQLITEFEPAAAHTYTLQCSAFAEQREARTLGEKLIATLREALQ